MQYNTFHRIGEWETARRWDGPASWFVPYWSPSNYAITSPQVGPSLVNVGHYYTEGVHCLGDMGQHLFDFSVGHGDPIQVDCGIEHL